MLLRSWSYSYGKFQSPRCSNCWLEPASWAGQKANFSRKRGPNKNFHLYRFNWKALKPRRRTDALFSSPPNRSPGYNYHTVSLPPPPPAARASWAHHGVSSGPQWWRHPIASGSLRALTKNLGQFSAPSSLTSPIPRWHIFFLLILPHN